ncbi:hypothetical protein IB024_00295 [Brucella sp. 6810]|uniref:hypothetical protein n=1 Tax=unclassified Brucella TaxID=2632610 RepID=UPI0015DEF8FF|nr:MULTISPECIES: hypothetical protein [unclassified Brucella]QNQ62240.1 hypothetical protein IB024_00295 [Brucella sp. 6810]CAB4326598.1 hypothetical protein BCH_01944 [Brucella sp. 191011898]
MGEQIFELSALTGIGSALGAVVLFSWLVFGRNRLTAAKWLGVCALIFCGSAIAALLNVPRDSTSVAATSAPSTVPAKALEPTYGERISSSSKMIADMKVEAFNGSPANLLVAVSLFDEWTKLYEEGEKLSLSDAERKQRAEFRRALVKKQTSTLPKIRDLYGPALRKQLWEADGKAKTFGNGFRTIEIINAAFAANRNIKQIHLQMYPTLARLRFTRSQYKWVDANVEYTYFDIKSPPDSELVIWSNNGSYRTVN